MADWELGHILCRNFPIEPYCFMSSTHHRIADQLEQIFNAFAYQNHSFTYMHSIVPKLPIHSQLIWSKVDFLYSLGPVAEPTHMTCHYFSVAPVCYGFFAVPRAHKIPNMIPTAPTEKQGSFPPGGMQPHCKVRSVESSRDKVNQTYYFFSFYYRSL